MTPENARIAAKGNDSDGDDGGADKSNDRLIRRKRQKLISKIVLPSLGLSLLCLCLWIFYGRETSKDGITMKKEKKIQRENEPPKSPSLDTRVKLPTHDDHDDHNKDDDTKTEKKHKYRWVDERNVPPVPGTGDENWFDERFNSNKPGLRNPKKQRGGNNRAFRVSRNKEEFKWDEEGFVNTGPKVDYTKIEYKYPERIDYPPRGGSYPPLETLGDLMKGWPQDDIDQPPQPFLEKLQHFDYQDPQDREKAIRYRDLEFPFKMYNVPELDEANKKWTDEYLSYHFDRPRHNDDDGRNGKHYEPDERIPRTNGHCQQSVDSFFSFYYPQHWRMDAMGPPPTLNNDFTFARFAAHARYADTVSLAANEEHFYWQSGTSKEERNKDYSQWTMIGRDLPSFSDPEPTFFGFNPEEQKGIQCRFGERGVAAATHYDGGRNMVAMITGAKRYILAPPNQCTKLGVVAENRHPAYRHSLLNFGHINQLDSTEPESKTMPKVEKEWLELARSSMAIETVLKAGEVLYIPSHWFHYIISLQKSAQCNTRSGRDKKGSPEFGGLKDVKHCLAEDD